jgi:NADH-quinone oxidoreductase subunit L
MLENAWILPALMVGAFIIILFFGKKLPQGGWWVGQAAVTACLALSTVAGVQWYHRESVDGLREPVRNLVTWFSDGNVKVQLGSHVDGFAVAMLFVVSFISFCVHVFSRDYLRDDIRFVHYFASLGLFTAAMLWMVQSATTLGLLFGWELMGLCSFLLIGHWWEDENNSTAALKAFLTTRTGDIGLLIGIIILFFAAGHSFDIAHTNHLALDGGIKQSLLLVSACCLFAGVVGKSAQFPLHTWLPDAMAGPTPASSLIHAATMVVAGVYLFGRLYGVFFKGFSIAAGGMNLGAWIGSITIVMAALLAFVQTDIKKVLAYSTVSQLGYMVMGLSVGAWAGAIFHLFTHAFFKALLFQGAGSISHSGSHHSFEMDRMGGLRKYMKWTFGTFTVGYFALCGIPPFSGFFSKDEILAHARYNHFGFAFAAGSVGAFLTAAYMTRVMYKVFFGENRLHLAHDDHGHDADTHAVDEHDTHDAHAVYAVVGGNEEHESHDDHSDPHESNWWIIAPLVLLAIPAFMVGIAQWPWGGIPKNAFEHFIANETFEKSIVHNKMLIPFHWSVAVPSVALACAGIAASLAYYLGAKGDLGLVRRYAPARWLHSFLKNKYFLDHLWTGVVVGSIRGPIAKAAYWVNQNVIDGVVNTVGKGAAATGKIVYDVVDQGIIDGLVNGSGSAARDGGGILRILQSGRVQNYAALFLGGVGLIALALALFV